MKIIRIIKGWLLKRKSLSPYSGTGFKESDYEESMRIRQLQAEQRRLRTRMKIQDLEDDVQEMRDEVNAGSGKVSSPEAQAEQAFTGMLMQAFQKQMGGNTSVPGDWDTPNPNQQQVVAPSASQMERVVQEWAVDHEIPMDALLDLKKRVEGKT